MRHAERVILLQVVDQQWKTHLLAMDDLKDGIGLRGYGQKDPLVEYKKESFKMFQELRARIDEEALKFLFLLQPVEEEQQVKEIERKQQRSQSDLILQGADNKTVPTLLFAYWTQGQPAKTAAVSVWLVIMLVAPKGLPAALRDQLQSACKAATDTTVYKARAQAANSPLVWRDGENFRRFAQSEFDKMRQIVNDNGLRER